MFGIAAGGPDNSRNCPGAKRRKIRIAPALNTVIMRQFSATFLVPLGSWSRYVRDRAVKLPMEVEVYRRRGERGEGRWVPRRAG